MLLHRHTAPTLLALVALLVVGCERATLIGTPTGASESFDEAPFASASKGSATYIASQYIVVFKKHTAEAPALARQLVRAHDGELLFVYRHALQGFAAVLSAEAYNQIRLHADVAYIHQDEWGEIVEDQPSPPSWGLDRIDQRTLPLDTNYQYQGDGTDVFVYVLDTGLDHDHPDFGGRTLFGADFVSTDGNTDAEDLNGHGTHVSGTVAGATYGVAKDATIVSMQVCTPVGACPLSGTIAAIDSVTALHTFHNGGPSVANMSLRFFTAPGMNEAIGNSTAAGVTYAVAAGNDNADACGVFPASSLEAITVGSSTHTDARSSFSNWGTCVNLFAPGSGITSAWLGGGNNILSGTSMASPHVAGLAAIILEADPTLPPNAPTPSVRTAIMDSATTGVLIDIGASSPNTLLYSNVVEPPPPAFTLLLKRVYLKPNGVQKAVLKWSSAAVSTGKIDFYIAEDPAQPDPAGPLTLRTQNDNKVKLTVPPGSGSLYNIVACEKNSTTACSNVVQADFTGALVSAEPDDETDAATE